MPTISSPCEIGKIKLNLIPSFIKSHRHGTNERFHASCRLRCRGNLRRSLRLDSFSWRQPDSPGSWMREICGGHSYHPIPKAAKNSMLPEVILHPLKNGGVHSTNREDASSVGQTCTSKEKYFFKFFMIMTKKGSFIPKVCFSSPGHAMKMVDTCDVPNIMERDYECRRSFLHSFP